MTSRTIFSWINEPVSSKSVFYSRDLTTSIQDKAVLWIDPWNTRHPGFSPKKCPSSRVYVFPSQRCSYSDQLHSYSKGIAKGQIILKALFAHLEFSQKNERTALFFFGVRSSYIVKSNVVCFVFWENLWRGGCANLLLV